MSQSKLRQQKVEIRDLSAEVHRQCWTALYRAADVIGAGLAEALYEMEADPKRWLPYADTVNNAPIFGAAAKCLRFDGARTFRRFTATGALNWDVAYRFSYRSIPWTQMLRPPNAAQSITGGWTEVQFRNNGNPVYALIDYTPLFPN